MANFKLISKFQPKGDQPQAIKKLLNGSKKYPEQTLLGVTGSGKTFTFANVIAEINQPTLVLAPNKTLAAQLYTELLDLFPENKICYFVSYYDYYQPESYLPTTDTYIEKDSAINEKLERLRLEATTSLLTRQDVIVVASVSCIYGLGNPKNFQKETFLISLGQKMERDDLLKKLVGLQYERNDLHLKAGTFRAKGNIVEFILGFSEKIIRVEFHTDKIQKITEKNSLTGEKLSSLSQVMIFPAKQFMVDEISKNEALAAIRQELTNTLPNLGQLEQYRLKTRTEYDLDQIENIGYCKGIENYSRHFDGRNEGAPPFCLLNYFPKDFLLIIDESHVAIPQIRGMYNGDRARKKNLIDYGFRLPSAYDNRPLKFAEFENYLNQAIYVSATPGDYEIQKSGQIVEQLIRPTGLIDPKIEIRPITGQIKDLEEEIKKTIKEKNRVLITTLTKKMAEELTNYFTNQGFKARYLHSEIKTLERQEILRNLRLGKVDILVGINLLREGLDLPEVSLVAILDADKEGFLRNYRSLIQTIGRAARNINGLVIMYADVMTESIKKAVFETNRRRKKQIAYNIKNKITPQSIKKTIAPLMEISAEDYQNKIGIEKISSPKELKDFISLLTMEMNQSAEDLEFEKAAKLRDKIKELKNKLEKK